MVLGSQKRDTPFELPQSVLSAQAGAVYYASVFAAYSQKELFFQGLPESRNDGNDDQCNAKQRKYDQRVR